MTLLEIYNNGSMYALNEITGELVAFVEGKPAEQNVLIPSDMSCVASMCRLLFDSAAISENWSPLSNCEARDRHERYTSAQTLLGGCIACQRVY